MFALTLLGSLLLSLLMQQAAEPGTRFRREWYRYPATTRRTVIFLCRKVMFSTSLMLVIMCLKHKKSAHTSLRGPCRLQEGGGGPVVQLAVWVPAGQQAGYTGPDPAVPLEEPVALLVIACTRDREEVTSVSMMMLQLAYLYKCKTTADFINMP